ncbi:MAG TPA: hypothetical protein VFS54_00930 [Solirubrobacterales bacterium]|nr:hypothetical protein [Solirubrobacterales bacterium]
MFAAARFQIVVCAIFGALLLVGCGGSGSATTTEQTTIASRSANTDQQPDGSATQKGIRLPVPGGDLCQSQLGSFVGSLDGLRRRLAVGVTYDQYVAEVRGIRSTYGEISIEKLRIDCLTRVATPSEKAFNRYIEGANDWGECVSELGCGTGSIEPVLQRRWRIASHFLSEAQDGLDSIAS